MTTSEILKDIVVPLLYLVSAALFASGLKQMSKVRTARDGNLRASIAMGLAVIGTLLEIGIIDYRWMLIGLVLGGGLGAVFAIRVPMTGMPGMVALLNGSGGAASALVGIGMYYDRFAEPRWFAEPSWFWGKGAEVAPPDLINASVIILSVILGGLTFSGSVLAYLKVQEKISDKPLLLPGGHYGNLGAWIVGLAIAVSFVVSSASPTTGAILSIVMLLISLGLGVLLVSPIGGADMPVVISFLNSLSGLAAAVTGFVVNNPLLIIAGALVGSSGLILTQIMCTAMNRSLANVIFGGMGATPAATAGDGKDSGYKNVRSCSADEAALVLDAARSLIIVPGYGLAVSQAQRAVHDLMEQLRHRGCNVRFAIHPVAGRMPGHMNVLLAEANVPYDLMVEMDAINPDFSSTDVVIVLGANDVVNPAAKNTPGSPIYGMPILEVSNAKTVFVIKRSLGAGFAGIKNELFEYPNTLMVFGDAKKVLQDIINELKAAS